MPVQAQPRVARVRGVRLGLPGLGRVKFGGLQEQGQNKLNRKRAGFQKFEERQQKSKKQIAGGGQKSVLSVRGWLALF